MYGLWTKTIVSDLIPERLTSRLVDSKKFEGTVRNTEFEIREKTFWSYNYRLPVIKGTIEAKGNATTITFSFKMSKLRKNTWGMFLFTIFLLALILGIISADILITMSILCFGIFAGVCLLAEYMYYCRRAYKKLCKIWSIKS